MISYNKIGRIAVAIALLGAGLALQGCREAEQGRPLSYDKGKYGGKTDQNLTEAQVNELRSRAKTIQKF